MSELLRIRPVLAGAIVGIAMLGAGDAMAQMFRRSPVAIENVRIVVGDGEVIERGTVLIQGDRIAGVGTDVRLPERVRRVDGSGMTVTPGLIDVSGRVASTANAGSSSTHRAIDAFDRYATKEITRALRNGLTTLYLPAPGPRGVTGVGTIVRLSADEGGAFGEAVNDAAALCIDLGANDPATRRLNTLNEVQKAFKDALAYREAMEIYEEELQEYLDGLSGGEEAENESASEDEEEPDNPEPPDGEVEEGEGADGTLQQPRRRRGGRQNQPQEQPAPPATERKASSNTEKPKKPARNPEATVLLRAIDHEMPVRVRAEHSADIENAIDIAKEFNLRLVIEGVPSSEQAAAALAAADAGVVLDFATTAFPGANETGRRIRTAIDAVSSADVEWAFGSGGAGAGGAHMLMLSQLAAASSPDLDPLVSVTSAAAEFLGLESLGCVKRGYAADLVLWSGDPLDAGTHVKRVYLGGRLAYETEDEGERP